MCIMQHADFLKFSIYSSVAHKDHIGQVGNHLIDTHRDETGGLP